MAGPAVKVEGGREVRATLRKLGAGARDMSKVNRKAAAMVLGPAQGATRRRSGALAGSYRIRASAAKASIASGLVYAPIQEFGWPRRGITPSNALVGALDAMAPSIEDAYKRELADLVDRLNATG